MPTAWLLIFGGLVIQQLGHVGPVDAGPFGRLDPWHLSFIVVGVPGLVLAGLMLTVREPGRTRGGKGEQERFTLAQIWHFLRERRGFYGAFYGGMSLHVIALYAFPAWIPSFLIRHYGVSMASVGLQYGASVLIAGSVGVWCGPYLAKFLAARGYGDAAFRTPALATLGVVPFAVALPFCPTYTLALSMATGVTFFYTLPMAMAASALQMVTPNRMRGVISSLYVFTVSIVGLGLAPTFIALITDRVFGDPGMVGWSLALVCSASSIGASVLMLRGLGAFRDAQAQLRRLIAAGHTPVAVARDRLTGELRRIYEWYNHGDEKPFCVDMAPILADLPVALTSLEDWARRQDWGAGAT